MYLEPKELEQIIDSRVLSVIIGDSNLYGIPEAIDASIAEAKSYLYARYDTDAIFSAEGAARNALLLSFVKSMTIYHLSQRSNFEMLQKQSRERYDRVIEWLTDVSGINPSRTIAADLPLRKENGEIVSKLRSGSNPKFTHSF